MFCLVSCRASTLSSAVSSLSSTGMSFSRMDEKEKQQALEEEQARLQALKVTDFVLLHQITSESGGQVQCCSSRNAGSSISNSYCCPPFLPSYSDSAAEKRPKCNGERCIFDLGPIYSWCQHVICIWIHYSMSAGFCYTF